MSAKTEEAQSHIPGVLVARIGGEFARHFRDTYPVHVAANFMAVGPLQSLIGLAIMNGHLFPANEVAELREQLATARKGLERIERWHGEFPPTGKFWNNEDGTLSDRPMSYGACLGSNGERDYMRAVARAALP